MPLTRYMIFRPKDGKLGMVLYKTEKEAWYRGTVEPPRKTEWQVVEVRTEVTDCVADPHEVEVIRTFKKRPKEF